MRIISGQFKGAKLFEVELDSTRSTTDKAKQAMFNVITDNYNDLVVADLFAGSGALNLEALSRGAGFAYFFELNPDAIKIIHQNVSKFDLQNNCKIIEGDFANKLHVIDRNVDIVFLDPPYFHDLVSKALSLIKNQQWVDEKTVFVCEIDHHEVINHDGYEVLKVKKYGRVQLMFLRRIL